MAIGLLVVAFQTAGVVIGAGALAIGVFACWLGRRQMMVAVSDDRLEVTIGRKRLVRRLPADLIVNASYVVGPPFATMMTLGWGGNLATGARRNWAGFWGRGQVTIQTRGEPILIIFTGNPTGLASAIKGSAR